jgi:glycosyltransferase involved in cell wall biosynthesis
MTRCCRRTFEARFEAGSFDPAFFLPTVRTAADTAEDKTMTDTLRHSLTRPTTSVGRTTKQLLLVTELLPASADDFRGAWILDFVEALRRRGVHAEVFTSAVQPHDDSIDLPVFRFAGRAPVPVFGDATAATLTSYFRIRECLQTGSRTLTVHLEEHRYDYVLALGAFPAGWITTSATEVNNIPFSVWLFGPDINIWARKFLYGRMVRRTLRRAKALFADGDKLCETTTGISDRECHFMPTLRRFHYRMLPIPREKVFLFVGALETHKGIFDLLRAFARIKQDIWDYRLLIIGSGSKADKMQRSINSLELRGKVHLLGNLTNDELVNYLQRARALIIPSHTDSIPLVFGEALQTATPMVVTDAGDLGSLVHDNKLGFVARRKSPASLADAMVRMIVSDFDIRANAKHLIERLSPDNAAQTFLNNALSCDD